VNLLLDSHSLLWFLDDDRNLVPSAKALIERPGEPETRQRCDLLGDRYQGRSPRSSTSAEAATTFLPRELATNKFDLLGIALAHATFVETFAAAPQGPVRPLAGRSGVDREDCRW